MKLINVNNNSAFSLVELMVGVGLSAIATLACFTLINQSYANYTAASNTSANIIETVGAAAAIRQTLSSAVNITYDDAVNPLPGLSKTHFSKIAGYVREFSMDATWMPTNTDGQIVTVFTGYIDQLKSGDGATANEIDPLKRFLPVTVFFQQPTVKYYGVLYMAIGDSNTTNLQPSGAQFQLDQIVDFKIKDIDVPYVETKKVARFAIEITRRNFKNMTSKQYIWCPPKKIPTTTDCMPITSYFDTSEYITINLRNNKLRNSTTQKQVSGTNPPSYTGIAERFQTGVYFLKPKISWDTLKR